MKFATILQAIEEIKQGRMLILLDNPNRENEADFYIPADKVTSQIITAMIRKGGGLVCCAITQQQAHRLSLPLMVDISENSEKTRVNFTVSVNAKKGVTSGVSSFDRFTTIKVLIDPKSIPDDLIRPGHVFGLVANPGGVLNRAGHTEAAVDLARLANLNPTGVLCEILSDDGKVANLNFLEKLSKKLNLKIALIDDLIKYLKEDPLPKLGQREDIIKTAKANLPTKNGLFNIHIYKSFNDNSEHVALSLGNNKEPVLTRIHSQCLTGDTFSSIKCDCGQQLQKSMRLIKKNGGVIIYLNQEGRGIGLTNKVRAYALQDKGLDTVEANRALHLPIDNRDYMVAASILSDLGISKVSLLTNNPEKLGQLEKYGIKIVKRIPLEIKPHAINKRYLLVKKEKLGHKLKFV